MSYTPGPWTVSKDYLFEEYSIRDKDENTLAFIDKYTKNDPENAQLIAAVPDLLEALESARSFLCYQNYGSGDSKECVDRINEKIAKCFNLVDLALEKARGKSNE